MTDKYSLRVTPVNSDDYKDTRWNYYSELYRDNKLIWSDYHVEQPTLKKIITSLELTGV